MSITKVKSEKFSAMSKILGKITHQEIRPPHALVPVTSFSFYPLLMNDEKIITDAGLSSSISMSSASEVSFVDLPLESVVES